MATIKKATFSFGNNGLTVETETGAFMLGFDELSDEIKEQAMCHGLKQKIADTYAGKTLTHEIDSAIDAIIAGLRNGTWNAGRSSNGGLWVEALARAAKVTTDEALAKWNGLDDETKSGLKKDVAIKLAKAEIEMERAKVKAEGTSMDFASL